MKARLMVPLGRSWVEEGVESGVLDEEDGEGVECDVKGGGGCWDTLEMHKWRLEGEILVKRKGMN